MNKRSWGWYGFLSALLFMLFIASPVMAVEISSGNIVNVPSGVLKGPLFISGDNITVNADVEGDIFAFGQSVTINGVVNGDVIAVANSLQITGNVLGDVRAAGNTIDINSQIAGSFSGVGKAITLLQSSDVKRDALLLGNTVQISGSIEGQTMGSAYLINLNGNINGDVRIWDVQKLIVGPFADIKGNVTYNSANQAQIDAQSKVGTMNRLTPTVNTHEVNHPRNGLPWMGTLWSWIAGILIWGAICLLFPHFLPGIGKTALAAPWASLGWGFLALLISPLAAAVFMFTIVGIPLSLLFIFGYIVSICLSKIIVADVTARWLVSRYQWGERGTFIISFIVAFLVLLSISRIPVLSFCFNIIIASMALGMLILTIYYGRRESPEVASGPINS